MSILSKNPNPIQMRFSTVRPNQSNVSESADDNKQERKKIYLFAKPEEEKKLKKLGAKWCEE